VQDVPLLITTHQFSKQRPCRQVTQLVASVSLLSKVPEYHFREQQEEAQVELNIVQQIFVWISER
jgi:hypothetical protein